MAREFPDAPLIGLGCVIWREGRLLLIRRGKPPRLGGWSLPGGGQELGETVEEGLRREMREETGLEIDLIGLVKVVDSVIRDPDGRVRYHYTILDYAARWAGGEAVAGDDAAAVGWFTPEEAESLDLWPETLAVIRESRKLL